MPYSNYKILMLKWCYLSAVLIGHLASKPYLLMGKEILQLPLFLIILSSVTLYHVLKKSAPLMMGLSILSSFLWIRYFAPGNMMLVPLLVLDGLIYLRISLRYGVLLYILFGVSDQPVIYITCLSFLLIIYYVYYYEMGEQTASLKKVSDQENKLQQELQRQDFLHKSEMASYGLRAENKRLKEKKELVQALHDQLGHSINGSVFQLEACKLMMDKKPEETQERLQNVIDELRKSMDAIRHILRQERPRDEVMNLTELRDFCATFQAKYSIGVEFSSEGKIERVSQDIWKILMDSLIEAFSNILKYAHCDKVRIELIVYPKIVCFLVQDNGLGCLNIKTGMGLQGISERVRKVGGSTDIQGEEGFQIRIVIPLEGEKDGEDQASNCR